MSHKIILFRKFHSFLIEIKTKSLSSAKAYERCIVEGRHSDHVRVQYCANGVDPHCRAPRPLRHWTLATRVALQARSDFLSLPMRAVKKDFRFEVERQWWIWHGYMPYSRAEERFLESPEFSGKRLNFLRDPMDERWYNEETAFPLHKPAIDVLGIPRRSRKQRGWYRVRSRFQLPLTGPLYITVLRNELTAVDLPPELIRLIVEATRSGRSPTTMASCARVCSHWARALQPQLFEYVILRSPVEAKQFLKIPRTSWNKLRQFNIRLSIEDKLSDAPFVHLFPRMQSIFGAKSSLSLSGPLPTRNGTRLRSIHGRLPRTPPRSCFTFLRSLTISNVSFCSYVALCDVVREIPNLEDFTGVDLSWESESAEPQLAAWATAPRMTPHLDSVALHNCVSRQNWLALLLTGQSSMHSDLCAFVRQIDEQLPVSEAQVLGFEIESDSPDGEQSSS